MLFENIKENDIHRRILFILEAGILEGDTEPLFKTPLPGNTEVHDFEEKNPEMLFGLFEHEGKCILWHYEDTTGLYDVTETFIECERDFDKTAQAIFDAEEDF